jgi:hypothetical protein
MNMFKINISSFSINCLDRYLENISNEFYISTEIQNKIILKSYLIGGSLMGNMSKYTLFDRIILDVNDDTVELSLVFIKSLSRLLVFVIIANFIINIDSPNFVFSGLMSFIFFTFYTTFFAIDVLRIKRSLREFR